ncbi:MAG: hypothetical protein ACRCZP_08250 [Phycicoccus sp.]
MIRAYRHVMTAAYSLVIPRLPAGVRARPLASFVGLLGAIAGAPAALGIVEPGSIAALLPRWAQAGWGTALTLGCTALLVGIVRQSTPEERLGLRLLTVAAPVYALAAVLAVGPPAAVLAAMLVALAASCWVRLGVIRLAEASMRDGGT